MRFLILNADYYMFLKELYVQNPGLDRKSYEEQMEARNRSLFGIADFYSNNLRKLGHEANDIHFNNEFMQNAWAKEHGIKTGPNRKWQFSLRKKIVPWLFKVEDQRWLYAVLREQIKYYKPDVLFNLAMDSIDSSFLKEIKFYIHFLVGQHGATELSAHKDFSCYDLVLSSFLPTVEYFQKNGILAELNRLGFEPEVLSHLEGDEKTFDITFAGNLFPVIHRSRIALLEILCERFPQMKIWSPSINHLPAGSAIRKCYAGSAWGRDFYRILYRSKITLNHHGDILPYANNMRLFEATGVGAMLVTDWKENLHELFKPGKEIIAYHTPEECTELVDHYLKHDDERIAIACAGQKRTLQEHTYIQRMQELTEIIRKCSGIRI